MDWLIYITAGCFGITFMVINLYLIRNKDLDTIKHLEKRIYELEKFQIEVCKREVFKNLKEDDETNR